MRSLPTMLEPVRVTAGANCPRRSDDARTYALLEQVRAGLLSIVVARDANPGNARAPGVRANDGRHRRSDCEPARADRLDARARRRSAPRMRATDFVQRGFMTDSARQAVVLRPRTRTCCSTMDSPLGYCFRVVNRRPRSPQPDRPRVLGRGSPNGRVDIDGALWVDTVARALRDIEFRYVGLGRQIELLAPRWTHRVSRDAEWNGPDRSLVAAADRDETRYDPASARREQMRTSYRAAENGGELARATMAGRIELGAHRSERSNHGASRLAARLRREPWCAFPTRPTGVANRDGVIEISDLVPGPYTLSIVDPWLAPIGDRDPDAAQVRRRAGLDGRRRRSWHAPRATS